MSFNPTKVICHGQVTYDVHLELDLKDIESTFVSEFTEELERRVKLAIMSEANVRMNLSDFDMRFV